ncbi:hypothetical protein [Streptosporangium sp. CA-115845]|uniref:hypothetical protein n=1 Tax=Streptosporangium sp. CA-115845 TaxID=3240071 RepID=UPI003D91C933
MRSPPRLRHHVAALLLDTARRRITQVTPDDVLDGRAGRILLTRADPRDAGVHARPGTGGRLSPGCGPRADVLIADINAHLARTWSLECPAP